MERTLVWRSRCRYNPLWTRFYQRNPEVSDEEGIRLIYGSDYPFTNLVQPNNDGYDLCAKAGLLNPDYVLTPQRDFANGILFWQTMSLRAILN